MTKQTLRETFLRKSQDLGYEQRRYLSHKIARLVSPLLKDLNPSSVWIGFHSKDGEVVFQDIIDQTSQHIKWAFPKIENETLTFWIPKDEKSWALNSFGVLEPIPEQSVAVSLQEAQGVFVPGVAFDKLGTRLGRGKAFYDRALREFKGKKIGVAFEAQVSEEKLPRESHDVVMDLVVTDKGVLQTSSYSHKDKKE